MNILEAIQSGKKFRRKGGSLYFTAIENSFDLSRADLIADDWETAPHKVEITKADFDAAIRAVMDRRVPGEPIAFDDIAKEIGL